MCKADPVACIKDCREEGCQLSSALLGDVAHPCKLVVEGHVLQLLQHHGQHPHQPVQGAKVAREGIQELLHKLCVVNGCQPYWTTYVMAVTTMLAFHVNRRTVGEGELQICSIF